MKRQLELPSDPSGRRRHGALVNPRHTEWRERAVPPFPFSHESPCDCDKAPVDRTQRVGVAPAPAPASCPPLAHATSLSVRAQEPWPPARQRRATARTPAPRHGPCWTCPGVGRHKKGAGAYRGAECQPRQASHAIGASSPIA